MESGEKILVTTLGASWQIIPELVGWTNPTAYDFFAGNEEVKNLRVKYAIESVEQFWIVTTENQNGFDKLKEWAKHWNIELNYFICNGIKDFSSEDEIRKFRSFLFRVVLKASELTNNGGRLYLSLTGGRKNMSADMHEAGTLFGCDAMFHIIDLNPKSEQRKDALIDTPGCYARDYLPVVIDEHVPSNFIISAGDKRLKSEDFPINIEQTENGYDEDMRLEQEIRERKQQSSQVYANFYARLRDESSQERDIFRQLYFLHPDLLEMLKTKRIGDDSESDLALLKLLPKADLHSHLGGVLTPVEIIEVAKVHPRPEGKVKEALGYADDPDSFERHIFGNLLNRDDYHGIDINPYQKLGDYQGSTLLQTKETISKAVEIYAQKLIDDNVRYVEIRCSPYKYTRGGLRVNEVVDCIMDSLEKVEVRNRRGEGKVLEYRIIYIIGRQGTLEDIRESVNGVERLMTENKRFANRLVGIDLAGDEAANPPSALRELFMPFLERCVHITIHAGETLSVKSIWEAVYHLSADRIGHGLTLFENPDLLTHFVDRGIGIEMCPSSNRQIVGYGHNGDVDYPLKDYMKKGLRVTLNTDNQGISRTSMSNEFLEAARLCGGLSLWECIVLIRNSLIVSFADKSTKVNMLRKFENKIFTWCNNRLRNVL